MTTRGATKERAPATPPCAADPAENGNVVRPEVTATKELRVTVTRRHNTERASWLEFCAAVTALAEQIPPGVNPTVSVRTITVSWEEKGAR